MSAVVVWDGLVETFDARYPADPDCLACDGAGWLAEMPGRLSPCTCRDDDPGEQAVAQ